jgi:hypothetical protein
VGRQPERCLARVTQAGDADWLRDRRPLESSSAPRNKCFSEKIGRLLPLLIRRRQRALLSQKMKPGDRGGS